MKFPVHAKRHAWKINKLKIWTHPDLFLFIVGLLTNIASIQPFDETLH